MFASQVSLCHKVLNHNLCLHNSGSGGLVQLGYIIHCGCGYLPRIYTLIIWNDKKIYISQSSLFAQGPQFSLLSRSCMKSVDIEVKLKGSVLSVSHKCTVICADWIPLDIFIKCALLAMGLIAYRFMADEYNWTYKNRISSKENKTDTIIRHLLSPEAASLAESLFSTVSTLHSNGSFATLPSAMEISRPLVSNPDPGELLGLLVSVFTTLLRPR